MSGRLRAPELLLFDLGGVLVDFTGYHDVRAFLAEPLSAEEAHARWASCPIIREFETGGLPPLPFAERFVREWRVTVPPERFLEVFRTWTRGLLPGARELLDDLRGRFRLACLSNSNETHWERNDREHGIARLFDVCLSSHQLRLHKPDPAIYREALTRLDVAAESVVFFDDSAANVDAARDVGLRAFQVEGVEGLRARLVDEALLPRPRNRSIS